MAAIDKRSNGRWRVRIRNRRAPALSKTLTRKADAMNLTGSLGLILVFFCFLQKQIPYFRI